MMGTASGGFDDERPVHAVTLTRSFELWSTPVTQGQWASLMGNNPSFFKHATRPVEWVRFSSPADGAGFVRPAARARTRRKRRPQGSAAFRYSYAAPDTVLSSMESLLCREPSRRPHQVRTNRHRGHKPTCQMVRPPCIGGECSLSPSGTRALGRHRHDDLPSLHRRRNPIRRVARRDPRGLRLELLPAVGRVRRHSVRRVLLCTLVARGCRPSRRRPLALVCVHRAGVPVPWLRGGICARGWSYPTRFHEAVGLGAPQNRRGQPLESSYDDGDEPRAR